MRKLIFNREDVLISLPFIIVLFVSFIAVNIERTSLIPKPVLDGFGRRLNCDFVVQLGCYPVINL